MNPEFGNSVNKLMQGKTQISLSKTKPIKSNAGRLVAHVPQIGRLMRSTASSDDDAARLGYWARLGNSNSNQ